jgi:hypothetical protein
MRHKSYLLILSLILLGQLISVDAQSPLKKELLPVFLIQQNLPSQFEKNLSGTLGTNIKIRMTLKREGKNLTGNYVYEKIGKPLKIQGVIDGQKVVINEFDDKDNQTGNFTGQFLANGSLTGIWVRSSDGKTFPFSLTEASSSTNNTSETKIKCYIKSDSGELEMNSSGDQITHFSYTNVGGNGHTCTMEANRGDEDSTWQDKGTTTTIYFKEADFKVIIEKAPNQYTISFVGENKSYFCGVRSILPDKLQVVKSASGYSGKKIN